MKLRLPSSDQSLVTRGLLLAVLALVVFAMLQPAAFSPVFVTVIGSLLATIRLVIGANTNDEKEKEKEKKDDGEAK